MIWTPEQIADLTRLVADGKTSRQIEAATGIKRYAILSKAKLLGLRLPGSTGESAKNQEAKRGEVLKRLRDGESAREIALALRVDRAFIREIRTAAGIAVLPGGPSGKPAAKKKASVVQPPPARPTVDPQDPAMVRGQPGVWVPPVSKWPDQIADLAEEMRFSFGSLAADLPAFNRFRVANGWPPLAVRIQKREGASVPHGRILMGLPV